MFYTALARGIGVVYQSPMIVSDANKPPVGGFGGAICDWERSLDPWHRDAFPDEFADRAPNQGPRCAGWMALDYWGNAIGFVHDGYDWKD